jgi:uncharacterized membrane protein/uncharacterized lipoprotein NlpE involved in copper resistance
MLPTRDIGRPPALRTVAGSVLLSMALAGCALTLPASRDALSQAAIAAAVGPDGPYRGTLPCADCAGIATELTLYRDTGGRPARYRLRTTYLGTRDGDRRADAIGAWQEVTDPARVRLDPQDDATRRSFLRIDADTLELLDRSERRIASGHDLRLRHDRARAAPPLFDVVRPLYAGTLRRAGAGWQFAPCRERLLLRARDVSPESMITAVLTDLGFDRRDGIYIEAFGRVVDGVVQFERLNRAGSEMGCPPPAAAGLHWQAQGNEPFWSVRSTDERLVLIQPGREIAVPAAPLTWRWNQGRIDRAQGVVAAQTEATRLDVVLLPSICRDTMADAAYGFRAEVALQTAAQARFSGCAYLGREPLP